RRRHGGERARQGLDLHRAPAGRRAGAGGSFAKSVSAMSGSRKREARGRRVRSTKTKKRTRAGASPLPRAELEKRLAARARELARAREEQAAPAEVLRIVWSSPGALEPVFQAMLTDATRLCDARFGVLFRFEGGAAKMMSALGVPPAFAEFVQRGAHRPGP